MFEMIKSKKPLEKEDGKRLLRDAAEQKLGGSSGLSSKIKDQTLKVVIHDLQVHQIELEMQNEELRKAQLSPRAKSPIPRRS